MTPLIKLSYKIKFISIYISTTLVGIALTLVSIYNASSEQQELDHLNNMHAIFSDRISNVSLDDLQHQIKQLSSEKYKVIYMTDSKDIQLNVSSCEIEVSRELLELSRANQYGGVISGQECTISWVVLDKSEPVLILHRYDDSNMGTMISAYRNRLIIPLIFFMWLVVWGSFILGNLINRLQLQKEEVEHLAMHDSLTGIANRKKFSERIIELSRYAKRNHSSFMLAMIDLNKFKNVNDKLGHQYGDILLQQVARRFSECIRDYDMVARFGGDEFILLLVDEDMDNNMAVLKRIYDKIIEEYILLSEKVTIGASIGVSYYPHHDTSYSDLVHKADIAMYFAKAHGGGIKVFDTSMLAGTV